MMIYELLGLPYPFYSTLKFIEEVEPATESSTIRQIGRPLHHFALPTFPFTGHALTEMVAESFRLQSFVGIVSNELLLLLYSRAGFPAPTDVFPEHSTIHSAVS